MITFLLATLLTFIFVTFFGYVTHWMLHQKFFKKLNEMHMKHHTLYSSSDYLSKKYRKAGKRNSSVIFIPIIGSVLLLLLGILYFVGIPLWILLVVIIESLIIGYMHDKVHELSHVEGNMFEKFKIFQTWRKIHYEHHNDMSKNYGIFWFFWDKLFKSFKDSK